MRALVILVLFVGIARADDKKLAEKHFKLAAKAYAAQNFEAAALNFDEAYKNLPKPEIAFSAAQAYRKLYTLDPKPQYVKRAVELYQIYLGAVKTGGRVGDATDNLLDMKRELAKLEAAGATTVVTTEPPKTKIGVNVTLPDQAAIDVGTAREIGDAPDDSPLKAVKATIDDKPIEPFALVEVEPTEHVIKVTADGYFPVEKRARAIESQSIYIDVDLKPMPAKVTVKTEADARIAVDGRYRATAPTGALELDAGTHVITVLRRGREAYGSEITVARGGELTLDATLTKTSQRRAVPWILGGAGVLAIGSVTTALLANNRDNKANDLRSRITMMGDQTPGTADEYDATVKSRDRFVTWTWVLGGAAVLAGGVGGFLFFFDRPDGDSGTVGVAGRF